MQNSSVLGLVAMKYRGAYNASKFALEGYTDTLRLELAGSGVQISLIEPGPIDTRFRANARAAFLRHIEPATSRHQAAYQQTLSRLEREGVPAVLPCQARPASRRCCTHSAARAPNTAIRSPSRPGCSGAAPPVAQSPARPDPRQVGLTATASPPGTPASSPPPGATTSIVAFRLIPTNRHQSGLNQPSRHPWQSPLSSAGRCCNSSS